MQQVTLNIPTEKMPVLRQFLQALGKKENSLVSPKVFGENYNDRNESPAQFHPYYDWEFFKNELEYE